MRAGRILEIAGFFLLLQAGALAESQAAATTALPDIRQLMHQVEEHQKQLEKVRENYTYTSLQTMEDIDADGRVKKTETTEGEDFFVNGHVIERTVKKNGQPLSAHEEEKETERVTKLVEKAEKIPPDQPLEGPSITVSRLLEIMDVRNPRRVMYRGRPSIVFDFIGRKDVHTHGLAEDASKKLEGTMWIDEADRQVAHLEVSFIDNFHVAGGLVATIEKGSKFRFDQAQVAHPTDKDPFVHPSKQQSLAGDPGSVGTPVPRPEGDPAVAADRLWLPTGSEATVAARVLLVKGMRQHFIERDYDFKRFQVETTAGKSAVPAGKTP